MKRHSTKKLNIFRCISFLILISILCGTFINSRADNTITNIDGNDFFDKIDSGEYKPPNHQHRYKIVFDDKQHWEECTICGSIKDSNKTNHTLTINGSWYVCIPNDPNRYAARRACNCGYESKAIRVAHGRLGDYINENSGVSNSKVKFIDFEKITYKEFKEHYTNSGTMNNGNNVVYTFGNFEKNREATVTNANGYIDSDLGYVFSGGPIGVNNNCKGTLQRLSIGDMSKPGGAGYRSEYAEIRVLVRFFELVPNGTKSQFINVLRRTNTEKVMINGKEIEGFIYNTSVDSNGNVTNKNHALYGMKQKYESMTDAKFNELKNELSGYTQHISVMGWRSDFILCNHTNNDLNIKKCHASSGDYVTSEWSQGCTYLGGGLGDNESVDHYCDMCGGIYKAYYGEEFQAYTIDLKNKELNREYTGTWGVKNSNPLKYKYTITNWNPLTVNLTVDFRDSAYTIVSVPSTGWKVEDNTISVTRSNGDQVGYNWDNAAMSWGWFNSGIYADGPHWNTNDHRSIFRFGIYYPYSDKTPPQDNGTSITYPSDNVGNKYKNMCQLNAKFKDAEESRENFVTYRVYEDEACTKPIYGLDSEGNKIIEFNTYKTGGAGSTGALGSSVIATYENSFSILVEFTKNTYIYVVAKDKAGNKSKPIKLAVEKIDALAPTVNVNVNNENKWTTSKLITFKINDAFGEQFAGLTGDNFDWKDASYIITDINDTTSDYDLNNETGSERKYLISGDFDEDGRNLIFYAQDANGNLISVTVKISHLDNTKPTIISLDKVSISDTELKVKVNSHDIAKQYTPEIEGSGVSEYIITSNDNKPSLTDSRWQSDDIISIPSNGTYYIWCKDVVGNISDYRILNVNHYQEKESINAESMPDNIASDYDYLDVVNTTKTNTDYYNTNGSNKYKNYNHHYTGYERYSTTGLDSSGVKVTNNINKTNIDIYYKRIRYTIKYSGNTNSSGNMKDQIVKYDKDFNLSALDYKKEYQYKLNLNGGEILNEGNNYSENGLDKILTESWIFEDWLFDNNAQRDGQLKTQKYNNEHKIIQSISINDNDDIELKAQWKQAYIELPTVQRFGCDFIGWFNVPQDNALFGDDFEKQVYKLGDGGDKITIEGTLRGVYKNNEDMVMYAWYDKKPVFINIYDGLFFEGQKVTYNDLVEMIGVFDYDLVWNYDEEMKNKIELNIDTYFKDLIQSIDNEINDLKDEIYELEEMKEDEDDTLDIIDDIKELREQLKKLLAKKDSIKESYKKAKIQLSDIKLIPTIARIEYMDNSKLASSSNAVFTDNENHLHENEYIVDYHSLDKMAENGIYKVDTNGIDYDNTYLDTCSNRIGYTKVTYQVYNEPIKFEADWEKWDDLENDLDEEDDSEYDLYTIPNTEIALEYTRTYVINFNYNPTLSLQNMIYYSDDINFDADTDLAEFVISRQALYDPEDLQSNMPWWSNEEDLQNVLLHKENEDSKSRLQNTIEIVAIRNITFDTDYENKHKDEVENFKEKYEQNIENMSSEELSSLLNEIYQLKYSDAEQELFSNIRSIGLTFDGHDQFGKYASNKLTSEAKALGVYTDHRPLGYIKEFNGGYDIPYSEEYDSLIYQNDSDDIPGERTVNLIFVNYSKDQALIKTRVFDRIRYINTTIFYNNDTENKFKYLNDLSENSYWGKPDKKEIIKKILEKEDNEEYNNHTGNYTDDAGKNVIVDIKDFTDFTD